MDINTIRKYNEEFLNSFLNREPGGLFNLNSRDLINFIPDKFVQTIYFDPPFSNNSLNDIPHEEDRNDPNYDKYVWFIDDKDSFKTTCKFYLEEFARILKDEGSVFLHLPWDLAYDIKPIADQVFGGDNYLKNEIIWVFRRWATDTTSLQENHHTILWYSKNPSKTVFTKPTMPRTKQTLKRFGDGKIVSAVDKNTGKRVPSQTKGKSKDTPLNDVWVWDDSKSSWQFELDEIDTNKAIETQRLVWGISHTAPIKKVKMVGKSNTYPFEKPAALLERLINMSTSNSNDVVLDFFAGTGVTADVCKKLNRKFLLNEISTYTSLDIINRIRYEKLVPGFPLYSHPHTIEKDLSKIDGREFEFWSGYTLGGISDDSYRGRDSYEGLDVIIPEKDSFTPGEVKKKLTNKDEWYKIKAKSEKLINSKENDFTKYSIIATKFSNNLVHLINEFSKKGDIKYSLIDLSNSKYSHLLNNEEVENRIKLHEIKLGQDKINKDAKKAKKKVKARRKTN